MLCVPQRSAVRALLLALAAVLVVVLVTDLARGGSSASRPARAGDGAASPKQGAKPHGPLYRIVGCASHGRGAYSHGPRRREVAIAFDDGPARDTPAFVRMLERAK